MNKCYLFLCLAALMSFSSCMDTKYVTKKSTFDHVVSQVREEMATQGFDLSGTSSETKNDLVVLETSYSKADEYRSELANNFVTRDTYRFTNASGHTMSYTVSYLLRETRKGEQYSMSMALRLPVVRSVIRRIMKRCAVPYLLSTKSMTWKRIRRLKWEMVERHFTWLQA